MARKTKGKWCLLRKASNEEAAKHPVPGKLSLVLHEVRSLPYTYYAVGETSWTRDPKKFLLFDSEEAARNYKKKIKRGGCVWMEYEEAVKRTSHWFWKTVETGTEGLFGEIEISQAITTQE
jgi:hypothetical protein